MFNSNKKVNPIRQEERCFSDNPTVNNLLYRESEVHGRINRDELNLRDNVGPADLIYT